MGCMLQFLDTWRVFGWLVDNLCAHVLHCLAAVALPQFWRSPVRANESSNRGPTREDVPRPFFSFWNFQKACRARALGAIARRGSRLFLLCVCLAGLLRMCILCAREYGLRK